MNADRDVQQAVDARLTDLLGRAQRELALRGSPTLPRPGLRLFDDRLDAGRAIPPSRTHPNGMIELNAVYLQRAREAMLEETVAHELAHLLVFHISPHRRQPPHGKLWQDIMLQWFGVKPERTHRFPTAGVRSRRQRRWNYRCACGAHELSTVRHHRVQRGTVYLCRRCHEPLRPERTP
ncbi:MAG: SprT-like domain-containing protein [Gammaproteobacteria bacterium]|nr:SprT-like domain-containing protein [Gammaproteobacteria bacterium]